MHLLLQVPLCDFQNLMHYSLRKTKLFEDNSGVWYCHSHKKGGNETISFFSGTTWMGESVWSHKGDMYIPKLTKNKPAIPKSNNLLIRDTNFQGRTCAGFNCTQTMQGKAKVSKANVWQSNSNAWNWVYCIQKFWYFLSKICIWQLRNIKIFVEDTIFFQINIYSYIYD